MTSQTWDAALYDTRHAFVTDYGRGVVDLLAPQPGERILDVGCGTGHLTRRIADAGAQVVGIDSSEDMITAARAAHPGLAFTVADITAFSDPAPFDAVFSNATLHWVPQAAVAAGRMAAALRPGGRLVLEMGARGNIAITVGVLQQAALELAGVRITSALYFPSLAEYAGVLEQHPFEVVAATLFDRPSRLDGEDGLRTWYTMFGAHLTRQIPSGSLPAVLARAEQLARPALFRDGAWWSDYRRLRVVAHRR